MDEDKNKIAYERIITVEGIPYWAFWIILGVSSFVLGNIILSYYKEQKFILLQIFFSLIVSLAPIIFVNFKNSFFRIFTELKNTFFENNTNEYDSLENSITRDIFSMKSWPAILFILFLLILELITIFILGTPFNSNSVKWVSVIGVCVPFIMCNHTAYFYLRLSFFLNELSKKDITVPFLFFPYPPIRNIQSIYNKGIIIATFAYVVLALAIWQGPYGFDNLMQAWLFILAMYPLGMGIYSIIFAKRILLKIKDRHTEIISEHSQNIIDSISDNPSIENVTILKNLMSVYKSVQDMKSGPIEIQGILSSIIAIIPAIVQLLIIISQYSLFGD